MNTKSSKKNTKTSMHSKTYSLIILAIGLVSLFSCSNENEVMENPTNVSFNEGDTIKIPSIEELNFTRAEEDVNDGINRFGLIFFNEAARRENIFDQVDTDNGRICHNIAVSPISATIALSMAANSCDDATAEAISGMFGYSDLNTFTSTANQLMRYLTSTSTGATLELANAVFYEDKYTPLDEWKTNIKENLFSSVHPIDFGNASNVDVINKWCSDNTHGLIPEFLQSIDSNTLAMFINAMYFYGAWENPFSKSSTEKREFNSRDYGKLTIDMMRKADEFGYFQCDKYQLLTIPFLNGITEMALILPSEEISASNLAKTMTYDNLYDGIQNQESQKISLTLPKFNISAGIDATEILQSLGLPGAVELKKMGINTGDEKGIRSYQKVKATIDEEGAELAAASEVEVLLTSTLSAESQPEIKTVTFDRPFLYFFINKRSGTILMAGVINNL